MSAERQPGGRHRHAITDHWQELVTVSLLGTDRREPPDPPPGAVADLVADTCRERPAARMLAAVAACAVARRAGVQPRPPAAPLAGPPVDERPWLPPAAARRWSSLVAEWPVLEDEWLLEVGRRGWRVPPDVLVGLIGRHRRDRARRAVVRRVGGPVVDWLVEHQPALAAPADARAQSVPTVADTGLDGLPALPVAADLVGLLTAGADVVVAAVRGRFVARAYGPAHRAVLVNFVARCRRDVLAPLAEALGGSVDGLARSLAEEASTRHRMLAELEAAG